MSERLLRYLIVIKLCAFTFLVFWVLQLNQNVNEQTESWAPPEIPKCDKELWERIRNGC